MMNGKTAANVHNFMVLLVLLRHFLLSVVICPKRYYEKVIKSQGYHGHREAKSAAPDGSRCRPDTAGLLKRYPVTATSFHLIGRETEPGWEQNEDISTLMPSLVGYGSDTGVADEQLRKRLLPMPLSALRSQTG